MADRWTEFFTTYDDLGRDIQYAGDDFSLHLLRWFANIEDEPKAAQIVRDLEAPIDIQAWLAKAAASGNSASLGSGELPWSLDSSALLGERIALTRLVAGRQLDLQHFVVSYMYVQGQTDKSGAASLFCLRIFSPTARDLKRRIQQRLDAETDHGPLSVPASDRVVTIDHNSDSYRDMVSAIDEVMEAVRGANNFSSEAEKAQATAELAAGKQLLAAPRVRA